MLPQINGVGTLTREPEARYTADGKATVSFGLAFNEKYKGAEGQQKENVTFIDCTVFGLLGEKVVVPYIHKGNKIYIVGKLKLDNWEKDGVKRSKHSVIINSIEMLGSKDDNAQNTTTYTSPSPTPQSQAYSQPAPQERPIQQGASPSVPETDITEDEIPF